MDTAQLDPDDYVLTFTPAPSRKRVAGWTERRQRHFILLLRRTGLVAAAARGVGLSALRYYHLSTWTPAFAGVDEACLSPPACGRGWGRA